MFTRVTLYKNCILSARNTEVFRSRAVLEEYLATLNKPYITDIDIDNVYTTLQGNITIDEAQFDGQPNYIKFEQYNDSNQVEITVYAFIDSFRINNGLFIISYTQDIWHTYIDKWTLRESLVTRSTILKPNEPYDLPLKLVPFGTMGVNTLHSVNEVAADLHAFAVVCKLQLFTLASGGNQSIIQWEGFGVYNFLTYTDQIATGTKKISSVSDLADILDKLQMSQNEKHWYKDIYQTYPSFARIVETYIIPFNWINNISLFKTNADNAIRYETIASVPDFRFSVFENNISNLKTRLKWWTLKNGIAVDGRTLEQISSFGTFTSQMPYQFDGLNKPIELYMSVTADEIGFYLAFDGKFIEITSNYLFLQDYEVTTPDVLVQREIARKMQTIRGIQGIIGSIAQIGIGIITMGASSVGGAVGSAVNRLQAFNQSAIASNLQNATSLKNNAKSVGGMAGGVSGLIGSIAEIATANAKKYMSFTSANNDTKAVINAYFDICYLYATTFANVNEVAGAINETGYLVDYFTNNLDITNESREYLTVKFDFVKIVGLSTEICEAIAEILTNGVKIWYTKNV